VQALAVAFSELLIFDRIDDFIQRRTTPAAPGSKIPSYPSLGPILSKVRDLYALDAIQRDLGWFLTNGVISPALSSEVSIQLQKLCASGPQGIADDALALVNAFGIPDQLVHAPIADDWVEFNK